MPVAEVRINPCQLPHPHSSASRCQTVDYCIEVHNPAPRPTALHTPTVLEDIQGVCVDVQPSDSVIAIVQIEATAHGVRPTGQLIVAATGEVPLFTVSDAAPVNLTPLMVRHSARACAALPAPPPSFENLRTARFMLGAVSRDKMLSSTPGVIVKPAPTGRAPLGHTAIRSVVALRRLLSLFWLDTTSLISVFAGGLARHSA